MTTREILANALHDEEKQTARRPSVEIQKRVFSPGDFDFEDGIAPDQYLHQAFTYAEKVASNRYDVLPELLKIVLKFYTRVQSEYDKEILLRLLRPWVNQFLNVVADYQVYMCIYCNFLYYKKRKVHTQIVYMQLLSTIIQTKKKKK
ncbi:hypothetical protein RFI_09543 [Reticulomyxa filosa]|uniref:Uncharacterized protein n=1 Tax=Reticulomyxa filosa TaxID=46433 RepID=X6NMV0_RETFI|nr:hypothetical protein RFI_09543 [Reticulomyxa filosa]|eukprot:ETO27590.1 hypothetical protein RFI_09543 [Reticulomyxa filosa]